MNLQACTHQNNIFVDDVHDLFRYLFWHRLLMSCRIEFGSRVCNCFNINLENGNPSRVLRMGVDVMVPTFSEHSFWKCLWLPFGALLVHFGTILAVVGSILIHCGFFLVSFWLHAGPFGSILTPCNRSCALRYPKSNFIYVFWFGGI